MMARAFKSSFIITCEVAVALRNSVPGLGKVATEDAFIVLDV